MAWLGALPPMVARCIGGGSIESGGTVGSTERDEPSTSEAM